MCWTQTNRVYLQFVFNVRTKTENSAANANRTSRTLSKRKLVVQGAITAICKLSRLLEIICM